MTRPWIIWLTTLTCVLIVLGAVGTMTHITLSMEEEIYVKAERERRVSEAVDQVEEYVEALLSRENSREASDFSPVQTHFNKSFSNGDLQVGNRLSPLFTEKPDNVKLYWFNDVNNLLPNKQVASPQFPSPKILENLSPDDAARGNLEQNKVVYKKLNDILNNTSEWSYNQAQEKIEAEKYGVTNLGQLNYTASCVSAHFDQGEAVSITLIQQELADAVNQDNNTWGGLAKSKKGKNEEAILSRKLKSNTRSGSYTTKGKTKVSKDEVPPKQVEAVYKSAYEFGANNSGQNSVEVNPYLGVFDTAEVAPFTALWVNEELMLIRNVVTETENFVQGVWLNRDKIQEDLLGLAYPFLPNAELKKVTSSIDFTTLSYGTDEISRLDRIPFEIIPGEIPLDLARVTPMRLNLLISWACVVLAIGAVGIMFWGVMKLSERRASFVSSVSHELRTPLTTFKLYSEMLADGMVKDPVKQQEYLEKLSKESDRLSHMVENVLSFSQIERGKKKRERMALKVGDLVRQLEPNLQMRLKEEKMEWENNLTEQDLDVEVICEPTSFDQILTNLVDNAAKYGKNPNGESRVRITGEKSGGVFSLRISDDGVGIPKSQEKRLFKAFHKSDIEAAHTQPGVGLGLALCRSLARSMSGDVVIGKAPSDAQGGCIELILPLA